MIIRELPRLTPAEARCGPITKETGMLTETIELTSPSDLEMVTPDKAAMWLKTRAYNEQRRVNVDRVQRYAELMRRGLWRRGDGRIIFGVRGDNIYLLNGQHRLNAIIESGVNVAMEVTYRRYESDAEMERDYAAMDQPAVRTAAQGMHVLGTASMAGLTETDVRRASTALAIICSGFSMDDKIIANYSSAECRHENVILWKDTIKAFLASVSVANKTHFRRIVNRSTVFAVGLITTHYQPVQAEDFWQQVALNDGLRRGDPAHAAVQYLTDYAPLSRDIAYAQGIARAWNAFYEARTLNAIRVAFSGTVEISGTPFTASRKGPFDVRLNPAFGLDKPTPPAGSSNVPKGGKESR